MLGVRPQIRFIYGNIIWTDDTERGGFTKNWGAGLDTLRKALGGNYSMAAESVSCWAPRDT